MAGESRTQEIQREVVSLRDFLEHKIDAAVERLDDRITAQNEMGQQYGKMAKEAVDKAEAAQSARNAVANEFRASLEDQGKRQVSTPTFEAALKDIMSRFDSDRERIATLEKANAATAATGMQRAKAADTSFQWINVVLPIIALIVGIVLAYIFRNGGTP